jgi:glutaredoxin
MFGCMLPSSNPLARTNVQYNPCPFCNKVKAYLDYSKIPWRVVEVDPLRKTEMKETGHKKVRQSPQKPWPRRLNSSLSAFFIIY